MPRPSGDDRVYDVVDELLEDVPLVSLIERSIDAEDADEAGQIAREAGRLTGDPRLDEKAHELVGPQNKQSLASQLDLADARQLRDASDERRLQPLFMRNFFMSAWRATGGTLHAARRRPFSGLSRRSLGKKYDNPFVFDKTLVSVASPQRVPEYTRLLGAGHPLFDAVTEWAIHDARDSFAQGATLCDPNIAVPQRLWLVRSAVEDGRHEARKRLAHQQFSVVLADHQGLRAVSPATVLNFTELVAGAGAPAQRVDVPQLSAGGSPLRQDVAESRTDTSLLAPALAANVRDASADEVQLWSYTNLTEQQMRRVSDHPAPSATCAGTTWKQLSPTSSRSSRSSSKNLSALRSSATTTPTSARSSRSGSPSSRPAKRAAWKSLN